MAAAHARRSRRSGPTDIVVAEARGLSNPEIGRELSMSEATVKAHVSRALAKLALTNRVRAVILVHEAGLADDSGT